MSDDAIKISRSRKLGRNGPDIFPIGIGAMSFAPFYGEVSESDSHAVLDAAMELGVNFIDTANVYGMGQSENFIGSFLRSRGNAAKDFFRIPTKAGIARGLKAGPFFNSPEYLRSSLENSLRILVLAQAELFYIPRRDPDIPLEDVAGTMGRPTNSSSSSSSDSDTSVPTSFGTSSAPSFFP